MQLPNDFRDVQSFVEFESLIFYLENRLDVLLYLHFA